MTTSPQGKAEAAKEDIPPSLIQNPSTPSELSADEMDHTRTTSTPDATKPSSTMNPPNRPSTAKPVNPTPQSPADPPESSPQMSPAALKLTAKISALEAQLPTLRAELSSTHAQLNQTLKPERSQTHPPSQSQSQRQPATLPCDEKKHSDVEAEPEFEIASGIVKRHITLLHQYNEIKDVGLGLMGLIADARGVRLGTVLEEFGVGGKD